MNDASSGVNDARSDADLSGRQFGDYQLLRRLGRGAMAEVYLAEQGSLRRQVAWKVLKSHLATDETYVRRFHHEAQAAASLVHANIVQIYDVGCVDGIHYIAQEYVQGQNLRDYLSRHGAPDVRLAVHIMRQVAAALCKAAERGIVHRDIKPDNIMLARTGEVKVADFGLARVADASSDLALTQAGITMGTPLYMSPEQIEGRGLDPRSDLYSFGVTCFHMLSGAPPFQGETVLSVAVQHLKTEPRSLAELRPDLPVELCRIVHKMLAKQPDHRYASPRDLLRDLRALPIDTGDGDELWAGLEPPPVSSGAGLGPPTAALRLAEAARTAALVATRRRRGRRWLLAAALVALLGGAALRWQWHEPFLLSGLKTATVPAQNSARDQLFVAQMQSEDPEPWLMSVERYFPDDRYYVDLARQELARYYLQNNRRDEAMELFSEFAQRDQPAEAELRAFGLAGQCVLLTMDNKHAEAARVLGELWPLRDRLRSDRRLAALLGYAIQVQRTVSNRDTDEEWDAWLRQLPPADEGTES